MLGAPLRSNVVMAMPMGSAIGGMTSNSAVLRRSQIFATDRAIAVDTSPPEGDYSRGRRIAHSARVFGNLVRTVRRHRADVVFFSSSSYTGFYEKAVMGLACHRLGAKTVAHLVGSFVDFHQNASSRERRMIAYLVASFDRVLVVASNIRDYLVAKMPKANIAVVPNPIECSAFPVRTPTRHSDGRVQILFAGAIVEGKGVLDLIAAVEGAASSFAGTRLIMIGGGALLDECRRRIAASGLSHVIEMPGFVDDATKKQLFASSDIFVLPSHFEAMPISVLEASSTGVPVVATDVGAVSTAVRDGETGIIVPARDPSSLASALLRLVRDDQLRREMGARGAIWVRERFDAPIVAGRLIQIFDELGDER